MAVVCTARQTPAPIEYLLRKAGLGQEESMPSSGRLDFMSQRTSRMSYRRRQTPGASLADSLSKTERLAAVSSIRFVRCFSALSRMRIVQRLSGPETHTQLLSHRSGVLR